MLMNWQDGLSPTLSPEVWAVARGLYAALMLCTLAHAWTQSKRFFLSERWSGYAASAWDVNALHNPWMMPIVFCVWNISVLSLGFGQWPVASALLNMLFCRYFFIYMRWKGLLRGLGAPGFIAHWISTAIFMMEFTRAYAPDLHQLTLFVLQTDFGLIIVLAGVYKLVSGYLINEGMELGMVNPEWGYWWKTMGKWRPQNRFFWGVNQLAWTSEILAGLMMLVPPFHFFGGIFLVLAFAFICTQIRLGFLTEMVMVIGLLFFCVGTPGDTLIKSLFPVGFAFHNVSSSTLPSWLHGGVKIWLWAYLALLPFAYGGLCFNFYAKQRLPAILQSLLDGYTNAFGMILWRVFSADLTNFYINIYRLTPDGHRELLSLYSVRQSLRFGHVGEAIAITCIFTSRRYYGQNLALFQERLLRYARTIPVAPGDLLVFEHVGILKGKNSFDYRPLVEYTVDTERGTIEERKLDLNFDPCAKHIGSAIITGNRPGSYAPSISKAGS